MKGMAVLRLVCNGQVGHTSSRWCCQPVDNNGNSVRLWDDIICLLNFASRFIYSVLQMLASSFMVFDA